MSTNKFESLLELLINEENDKAEALFHEIVVEKSRDIYENLADEEVTAEAKEEEVKETEASEEAKVEETAEEKVEETTEEAKDEEVKETSEETKDEEVAIEDETTEEESIEEVGGDATDELVKDISAEEEGEMDADKGEEMPADMDADKGEEDMEDRVVDLEDALDELKAEFEAMMSKKDGDDEAKDETVEMPAQETPEMPVESKEADAKETVKEYKNMEKADNADHADHKASPVKDAGSKMPKGGDNIAKGGAEEKGRPAPTAKSMNATTEPKMKEVKADSKDGSDKSAKSPVASK